MAFAPLTKKQKRIAKIEVKGPRDKRQQASLKAALAALLKKHPGCRLRKS